MPAPTVSPDLNLPLGTEAEMRPLYVNKLAAEQALLHAALNPLSDPVENIERRTRLFEELAEANAAIHRARAKAVVA